MIEIKDLISRLSEILLKEEDKTEILRRIIEKTIGVKIDPKDIKIKNHVVYINLKPIYKNEILIKKEEILLQLEENLIKKIPTNIR